MTKPRPVADVAPVDPFLTGYDMNHLVKYVRLLDADADRADWREVARIVLSLDVEKDEEHAKRVWRAISREPSGLPRTAIATFCEVVRLTSDRGKQSTSA
jgi:hypothetical protein